MNQDELQEMAQAVARRLKEAMDQHGLSVKALAAKTGFHANSVYRVYQAKGLPGAMMLIRFADELQVSTDWLLGRESQPGAIERGPAPRRLADLPVAPGQSS